MSLFPVYINENGTALPEDGFYYVVASNGVFVHKEVELASLLVKSNKPIPGLDEIKSAVRLKVPKIPLDIFHKTLYFFRRVYDKYSSEAAIILYYDPDTRQYAIYCPEQDVSGGSVNYDRDDNLDNPERIAELRKFRGDDANWGNSRGFRKVGTIHSHCNFSAFHSGTDIHDEIYFDGVHITIGHVNSNDVSITSSLVNNSNRFEIDPIQVISGVQSTKENENLLTKAVGFWKSWNSPRYIMKLTAEEQTAYESQIEEEIEKEWLPKVQKKTSHFFHQAVGRRKKKKRIMGFHTPGSSEAAGGMIKIVGGKSGDFSNRFLKKVRRAARILREFQDTLTDSQVNHHANILRQFFKRDVTDNDIDLVLELDKKGLPQDAEEKAQS